MTGATLVAVDGLAYDEDRLKDAIKARRPFELLVKTGDHVRPVRIDYAGGLRYPRLERLAGSPARLDAILTPRS